MRLLHPRMAVVTVVAILALVLNVAVPMAFASEGGPSATLTVRVVDADGTGRPEVSVRIGTGPAEEGNVVTVVTTDQAGEATLELEPGSYWVSAIDTDLALEAGRYVTLEDGPNAVELTLDTAKKTGIQGTVQGPTAILTITSGEQWWRVERPQQYSIELPPLDPGHLYIFTVQYGSSYYERPFEVRAGTVTTMPTVFADPAQQGCSDVTISLELPSDSDALPVYVEFWPVSSTGEGGCHDLAVDLQDRGVHNGRWYATLDSGGSANLNSMAPGEYDVVVGFENQQGQQWQDIVATNVTLVEGTNPIGLLASDRLMIRGVAKINGNPAANTKVVAWEVSEKYGFHVGEAVTDEQGNFEMVVPQGTIQFCLERNCIPVEVQGGPEFNVGTLDFGDHSPAPWPTGDNSLQVVVTDADGNPAVGAWVSVDYWSAEDQGWLQVWSGETDDSGVAAINNVPSGTYRISVGRGIGQALLRLQQEVELDETDEVVEITAPSEISEGKSGVQGGINVDEVPSKGV